MVFYSDDPIADFERYDRAQQEMEDKLPHCECCGEAIYEHVWEIDDEILCEDCARGKYVRNAEDYLR